MLLNAVIGTCAFLALLLFALWAVRGVGGSVDARIRALAAARRRGEGLAGIPFQQRVMVPLVESIGGRVASMLPGSLVGRTERKLMLAGQPMRPATFHVLVLALGALLAGTYLLVIFAVYDGGPPALALLPAVLLGTLGAYLPMFWLSSQARSRQAAMLKGLPDSMDLVTICVEAGLGLDAAFHRVAEKQSGPFVDEIRQMLREIGLGKARRQALVDLSDRTNLDDIRSFVNGVIQAEQLGTSLAQVLRVQSQRLRVRRRQRAEQEARRAPVKMVFPLVFCLMPSLFIFILGPIIINVIYFVRG